MTTEIKWSLRQNMWKVSTGIIDMIQTTKVIICPGYHNSESCPKEVRPEELKINSNNKTGNRYINNIKIGDYAIYLLLEKNHHYVFVLKVKHIGEKCQK